MNKKTIFIFGIAILVGLMLAGCGGYYGGYGYYDDYPYYNSGYGHYGYPNYHGHDWGEHSMDRGVGVAPRFEEHHAPPSGHTEQTHPMNRTPAPKTPAHENEHGDEHGK